MALKEMAVPESPKLYTKKYQSLLGVDYSCDITEVDQKRTPTGTNMISDEGANPTKRLGWRIIASLPESAGKILKTSTRERYEGDSDSIICYMYVLAEHGLYELEHHKKASENVVTKIYRENEDDSESTYKGEFFYFNNRLFVMVVRTVESTGEIIAHMREIKKGTTVNPEAYIPEATISRRPNGSGGTSLEAINVLTQTRTFSFLADGTSTDFYLYPKNVRDNPLYSKMRSAVWTDDDRGGLKVERLTDDGWELVDRSEYTLANAEFIQAYSANKTVLNLAIADCVVKFNTAPPASQYEDNIRITFTPVDMNHTYSDTIVNGMYRDTKTDILGTNNIAVYGNTTMDRIFVVGGTNKNKVYYSAVNNPTYFPDNNYITIGYDTNEIKGLVRVSDSLAAIKSDSIYDNTLYMIRGSFYNDNAVFTVVATSAKLGAISTESIKTLIDEPLFLTRNGVFGIANVLYTTEKTIRNRSKFLDRKLVKEENLDSSCATVWDKYYILCVNSKCYILDGRKIARDITGNTDYQYEAYYWENIPATSFAVYNDDLFFTTADGNICKLNTDVFNRTKYCDNGKEYWQFDDEGHEYLLLEERPEGDPLGETVAIPCEWSTPLDDDGAPQYFKTLNKKGNLLTLLPYEQSSADVILNKDGEVFKNLERFYADIFDWAYVDFARFPFSSNITARDDYFRVKIKKYKRLQIIVRNDALFEPFGILGLTKTYYYGNFAK